MKIEGCSRNCRLPGTVTAVVENMLLVIWSGNGELRFDLPKGQIGYWGNINDEPRSGICTQEGYHRFGKTGSIFQG